MHRPSTLLLTLMCAACLPQGGTGAPPAASDAKTAPAWQSPGKQGAPVKLAVPARYEAQPGETFEVALALVTTAPAQAVSVAINAGEGLLLATPLVRHELGAREAGRIDLPAVVATAQHDGRSSINVSVSMETAGGLRMRHFTIPVQVGDAAASARKRAVTVSDDDAERVRVMKGVETP